MHDRTTLLFNLSVFRVLVHKLFNTWMPCVREPCLIVYVVGGMYFLSLWIARFACLPECVQGGPLSRMECARYLSFALSSAYRSAVPAQASEMRALLAYGLELSHTTDIQMLQRFHFVLLVI